MADAYNDKVSEPKWQEFWEKEGVYKFDPDDTRPVYSVDTPPPTISGKMHLGHAFSYSQQDFIVRYKRMRGFNVFFPFGADNNGIATERLIEKMKGVRSKDMSREAFIALCLEVLEKELVPKYIKDFKSIGMSCDLSIFYTTINEHCRRISQRSFIDLYNKGREYRKEAPAMWCPECQTGISQVECEDKEVDSNFNDIVFKITEGGTARDLIVATTRPELLSACVAVFFHPTDKRYVRLRGMQATVPLYNFTVPIMADERADPEKGTGLVMCCTFGDMTDMEWQRAYNLPIKVAITTAGRMTDIAGAYKGLSVHAARKATILDLQKSGLLLKQTPIRHAVKVHERCGTEIEFVHSKQWFIKYLDLKEEMLAWGRELNWYPGHMRVRYEHWVNGLQWDWLISRQRYFGVPFPVWYCKKCEEVILAADKDLPVDPIASKPPVQKCPKCGCAEFVPEQDILDTWATSSLSPRITTEMFIDKPIFKKLFPMSLRPQAHDIITFWLFNTTVKSRLHHGVNPWKDVVISGHAQDPHGKKMSKSKGNIVEPVDVIAKYSADCLRFWAAGSKLGDDMPYQEKDLATGKKFVTKLWNACRFSAPHLADFDEMKMSHDSLKVFDRWLLTKLYRMIGESTDNFEGYEYSRTKALVENFFWQTMCDNYLEIVKDRLYNPEKQGQDARRAAQHTLYQGMLAVVKLMAPILPYITEELYQTYFRGREGAVSVHASDWPSFDKSLIDESAEQAGDAGVAIINAVRKYKSEHSMSMGAPIKTLMLDSAQKELLCGLLEDLRAVTKAEQILFGEKFEILV